jgi:hypothetical protein
MSIQKANPLNEERRVIGKGFQEILDKNSRLHFV